MHKKKKIYSRIGIRDYIMKRGVAQSLLQFMSSASSLVPRMKITMSRLLILDNQNQNI